MTRIPKWRVTAMAGAVDVTRRPLRGENVEDAEDNKGGRWYPCDAVDDDAT